MGQGQEDKARERAGEEEREEHQAEGVWAQTVPGRGWVGIVCVLPARQKWLTRRVSRVLPSNVPRAG